MAAWLVVVKMEDCCSTRPSEEKSDDSCETKTSNEKKMDKDTKNILLWATIAILVVVVGYVFLMKDASSAASATGQVVSSSSGMVGGC